MATIKTFNGVSLLEKILEFVDLTPDEMEWNYQSLSSNQPRLIRLQQINSLLKAFSLTKNKNVFEKTSDDLNPDVRVEIKSILNGNFIKNRKLKEYHELIDFAKQFLQDRNHNIDIPIGLHELRLIYPKMIDYKIKLREIIGFNSGWLEASSAFSNFHIQLTKSISSNLINKYGDLDHALELFINPKKLLFTKEELIEKFHFPTDDLHQIDMDNF